MSQTSKTAMQAFAIDVVRQLRHHGHVAYFAGGCVRDLLLNVQPKDYDVATSAHPEQVRDVFGRRRTIAIGESFGVITVLGAKPLQVEVATFRADGEYTDGRHPDNVVFSSAAEDAARRDFTINGMFFDPIENEVIDFVGGREDLQARRLRAIGSAAARIEEDHLRMLRAVRFAATYDFAIDTETLHAIQHSHAKIQTVSQERITQELTRMLCNTQRQQALELLLETKLLDKVIPEVADVARDERRWTRLLAIANKLRDVPLCAVLALLLGSDGGGLSDVEVTKTCRRMKLSNEVRRATEWIVQNAETLANAETLNFSVLQPLLIHDDIEQALTLLAAVASIDNTSTSHVVHCREKLKLAPAELDPAPLIRGDELAALGIPAGPIFADVLRKIRAAQLDGDVRTSDEAIELARRFANV